MVWAWLGEQGCAVALFHECLVCRIDTLTDEDMEQIIAERERRERLTGLRVMSCFACMSLPHSTNCQMCNGKGWILGRPPPEFFKTDDYRASEEEE